MTALAILVHWVHVATALVWFGGQVFLYLALWPAVLGQPLPQARTFVMAIAPQIARLMRVIGPTVVVTGLLRGTVFGPIRSLGTLATSYGLTFLTGLAVVVALIVHGGRLRATLGPRVFADGAFPDGARAFLARQRAITLGLLSLILVCMVLMRFGV
jgi:uncharacterized membrane protein